MDFQTQDCFKKVQEAMEINQTIQNVYSTFMSMMGFPETVQNLEPSSSNIFLNNVNPSTAEVSYGKSYNISANF